MQKITIVDSYVDILELFPLIFKENNFQIDCCISFHEMYQSLTVKIPDLMIFDITNSGIGERAVCNEIRQQEEITLVPIIIMSIYSKHIVNYKSFGANDAIGKPFNVDDLRSKVTALLSRAN